MSDAFDDEGPSDSQSIIEYCTKSAKTETIEIGESDEEIILVTAPGRKLHSVQSYFDEVRERPRRHKGFAELSTAESFVAYCTRYRDDNAIVLVDDTPGAPLVRAIFNYHGPGGHELPDVDPSRPGFRDYGALYRFPISDEWWAWTGADGKAMTQGDFAEFLEDRIVDVIEPKGAHSGVSALADTLGHAPASPSKLLALSRGLTVHASHKVAEHRNLATGEGQVAFETTHQDERGQALRVPGLFAISIPVFRHEQPVTLAVRLRYRVHAGQISWTVKIHQAQLAMNEAIRETVGAIGAGLEGTPVMWGTQAKPGA